MGYLRNLCDISPPYLTYPPKTMDTASVNYDELIVRSLDQLSSKDSRDRVSDVNSEIFEEQFWREETTGDLSLVGQIVLKIARSPRFWEYMDVDPDTVWISEIDKLSDGRTGFFFQLDFSQNYGSYCHNIDAFVELARKYWPVPACVKAEIVHDNNMAVRRHVYLARFWVTPLPPVANTNTNDVS